MLDKYYEEELRYLYESGKEFAKAHPDRAAYLNIDAVGDRDPYVERLFEGFAFLTAGIREKLDDSFPELTEGLLRLTAPHLISEIPSCVIAAFQPRSGMLPTTRVLPRGTEALSKAVGPESTVCRFSTTQDLVMQPISLADMRAETDSRGNASLEFGFRREDNVSWHSLELDKLRLYIHAELPTALMLHEFLVSRVREVTLSAGGYTVKVDPAAACRPAGFEPEESLLATDSRNFPGYALLQEYFVFPEKFLFVDLHGFKTLLSESVDHAVITYRVNFEGEFSPNKPFTRNAFQLYCSPMVNIFRKETEPVRRTGLKSEYLVRADANRLGSMTVHSIEQVTGVDHASGERREYAPLYSFSGGMGTTRKRTFAESRRATPAGLRETFLSFGGPELVDGELREETIVINAWCTNGGVPRDELREGDIHRPGRGFPDFVSIRNLTRPAPPRLPPDQDEYRWALIRHFGATYASLASADTLKALLRTHDWSGVEGRGRRIDAIVAARAEPSEVIVKGCLVRGIEFTVEILSSEFSDTGDLHLFGRVLKEFIGGYVSINSFLKLTMVLKPDGTRMSWDTVPGNRCLI